jgi:hypothetical protein
VFVVIFELPLLRNAQKRDEPNKPKEALTGAKSIVELLVKSFRYPVFAQKKL